MAFKSALDDIRKESEASYRLALTKAQSMVGGSAQFFGGGMGLSAANSDARTNEQDNRTREQHFKDQVYTSVRPIALRIAGQPIRLAKIAKTLKGRQQRVAEARQYELPSWVKSIARGLKANEDLTVIDQHPILDSLSRPAPSIPGWSDWHLKYATTVNLETTGYGYWWMPIVKGVREVYSLPPSWVRPDHEDELFGGWYVRFMGKGEEEPVPPEEIAPFWYPDPSNPLLALGPLEAGAKSVLIQEYVTRAQKQSFERGIHPSALITVGSANLKDGKGIVPRLKNFQIEQIAQTIKGRYAGMVNWGEPMILDRLIADVKSFANKPNEMDFGNNAELAKARVEQIFGTNPYTAGAASLSSRAESGEADRHFVVNTVNPKIELLSRVMTICVLPQFDSSGQYILFIEPARPHDSEMEQREHETALKYGAETINEYRTHVLRLPPIPGGDVALVPTNMQYVKIGDTVPKPIPSGGTISPSEPVEQTPEADDPNPDSQDAAEAEGDEANKALRRSSKTFDAEFYDAFATSWLKTHSEQEASMQDAVLAFFSEQGDDVAGKIESLGDGSESADEIVAKVFDVSAWDAKFRDAIKPSFAKAIGKGARQELDSFGNEKAFAKGVDISVGFDFGVDLPETVLRGVEKALAEALSKDYWAEIQQTTKDALSKALKDGLEAGNDARAVAKRVKDDVFGGDVAKERAKAIARSETTNALGAGAHEARLELAEEGVIEGKEWFATFDGRTRDAHLTADGQRRGVDEPFEVGGEQARWPGDPNLSAKQRINCRCASASVTVFTKSTRAPHVKAFLCRGCEVHGEHHT